MYIKILNINDSIFKKQDLIDFIRSLNNQFDPPFITRIDSFESFVEKICSQGQFDIAMTRQYLAGIIGYYCNDCVDFNGYISYLAVSSWCRGRGVAAGLIQNCIEFNREVGMRKVKVRADKPNLKAISIYQKCGFRIVSENNKKIFLEIEL